MVQSNVQYNISDVDIRERRWNIDLEGEEAWPRPKENNADVMITKMSINGKKFGTSISLRCYALFPSGLTLHTLELYNTN